MLIYTVVAFIGCIIGYFIAKYTKEELKSGFIYFKILELVILSGLIFFFYSSFDVLFFIGFAVGLFFRFEYFYFSLGLFSNFESNFAFLSSSLVFLYGLPYGSLLFIDKKFINLVYSFVFFLLGATILFFKFNVLSFTAGGLIGIFIIKSWRFFAKSQ